MKKIFTFTVFLLLLISLFNGNLQAQSATALKFDPSLPVGDNTRLNYVGIDNPYRAYQKEITVEFWMYAPSANLPFGSVMGQATNNYDQNMVWLMHPNTDGTMTFYVNDGGTLRGTTINIIAGSWHHYAGVANATSTKFYIDGVLMNTGPGISNTIVSNPTSVIHIGKDVRYATHYAPNGDFNNRYATMSIDEVRIWSRALCKDEINSNKNCELFNPAGQNNLENYYNFNQGIAGGNNAAVTTLNDQSGKNRNGTLYNFSLNGANSNWVTSGSTNTGTCAAFVAPTAPIAGTTSICIGNSTVLSNARTGGTWTSSNTAVATINATTGVVASVGSGTSTISYKTADCGGVSTATFTVNPLPNVTANHAGAGCVGDKIELLSSPGVSYSWTGPNGFSSNQQNPIIVNGILANAGVYTVTVTNINGCSASASTTVAVNALPVITAGSNSPVCVGGTLNLTSNGGVSYIWAGPNGFNSNTQNPSLTNIVSAAIGTYVVKGTGANGCRNDATVVVTVNTIDSDGDGIPDACDDDADNDGIPNTLECNKSNFYWSNPPTVSGNTATGTINGIGYTYTSSSPVSTTTSMYAHGTFPASYGVPNANPTIKNLAVTNNTITFASPMTNPVLVFASIGQGGLPVPITFGAPIQIVWSQNVVLNSPTQITGTEGYVIIRMMGTFSSINFNYLAAENYCNFAFGADFQSCGDTDNDATPDYLDIDSDGDGCVDAIEGSMSFSISQTSGGRLTGAVNSRGIPILAGSGQGVGTSGTYILNCFCQPGLDETAPTVITKNITVNLDAGGNATITASQVNNGSTDACGIASITVSKTSFNCSNVGVNTVILTVTDNQGNVGTATATVTVTDTQSPNVVTQNLTVYLDNNGQANITAAQVNNGSTDNCGIAAMSISPASVTCADITAQVTTNTQTIVSDNTWKESTTTYSTPGFCTTNVWNGVTASLPSLASYTITPTINAYSVTPIPGTQGLFGLNGVRFFRKTFNLSSLSGIKATLLASMDNGLQVYINGVAVALEKNADGANFSDAAFSRVVLNSTGVNVNGGAGFQSFDNITNANASGLFVLGTNEIVLALANCDNTDKGALSFKAIIENNQGGPGSVVLTVTDVNGNSSSASAQLTVVDIIKPVTNCPANMEVYATSAAGAVVTYNAAVATDNCSVASIVMTGGQASGSTFPIGTTTVSYRATDASGNFTDCSFTVTVRGLPPVITCPGNIILTSAQGQCGTNVAFAATETTAIPASAISYSVNGVPVASGSFFPVGTTVVEATATNPVGTVVCSFTVTVNDNQKPVIAPVTNISVNNDANSCGASVPVTVPSASDNCGAGAPSGVRSDGLALTDAYPVGTTTITWTVTDIHGNAGIPVVQTIVVTDNTIPVITANGNKSVSNDAATCGAVVTVSASAADNCGAGAPSGVRSDGLALTDVYPVGTTTITWTVTDIHGNTAAPLTQTIEVTDNEKPVITCPSDVVYCANYGGITNYTINALTAGDNCGILTTTYAITGATTRSGSGNDASGTFAVGVSTITWTVTDIHGNQSICSTKVTINPLPVATYISTNADAFCNKTTLTASSSINPASYSWTSGSTPGSFVNNAGLALGLANADGIYNVFVKATNTGCISEFPVAYNFQKQTLASSYTILTYKDAEIGRYNKVNSGSVGVMTSKGEAEFKSYSSVTGTGSFVKAPKIDKDGSGIVLNSEIIGLATVTLPTMQHNTTNTNNLSNYNAYTQNATLTGHYKNLTIKKGVSVTVTGTTFGKIKLEEGASIKFTSPVLNIGELVAAKGAKNSTYSYIRFAAGTSVRMSAKVSLGSHVWVNPDNNKVTFYIDGQRGDDDKFRVKGGDTKVIANVYMPNGKLKVTAGDSDDDDNDDDDNDDDDDDGNCDHRAHSNSSCKHRSHQHNDCDHHAHNADDCSDNVYMTGLFIAEEVESKGNAVIWNSYDCSSPVPSYIPTSATTVTNAAVAGKEGVATSEEGLKVTVMPNPTTTYFTMKLESRYQTLVALKVMDASGRVVDAKSKIGANSTIQIGHNYSSGTYYAELVQGGRRKVVQLIKGR